MPYFITDESPDCAGWATIKEDGEVIGCHTTKQAAIDQMVAVSIAEDMEPGGERALGDMLMVGDYVSFDDKIGEIQHVYREGKVRLPTSEGELTATADDPVAIIQVYEMMEDKAEETDEMVAYNFSDLTRIAEPEESEEEESEDSESEDEMEDEMEDRALPSNYRPASSADVPANHNCGNCGYYKNFYCKRWDAQVSPAYYCNAWEPVMGIPNENPGQTVQTGNVSDEDPNYYTDYRSTFVRLHAKVSTTTVKDSLVTDSSHERSVKHATWPRQESRKTKSCEQTHGEQDTW